MAGFGFDGRAASAATVDEATVPQDVDREIRPVSNDEAAALADVEAMRPPEGASVALDDELDERARAAVSRFDSRVVVSPSDDAVRATETITGTVVDGEGGPIAGVTVVTHGRRAESTIDMEGSESKELGR